MKYTAVKYLVVLVLTVGLAACDVFNVKEVIDPNNPSLSGVQNNASKGELQNLVTGLEARNRTYFGNTTELYGSFGREVWAFFESDPRFTIDWLGQEGITPYPDFFGSATSYEGPYRAIKQANILMASVENTDVVTDAQKKGYDGFAKTIQGFQYLIPLNGQYENGIRIDVQDPLAPGPVLGYSDALGKIRQILDDGASDLQNAGGDFSFNLTAGFDGFDTPAGMYQVNRAIAARAAIYAKDWQGALDALDNSFMDISVGQDNMMVGPKHVYGDPPDSYNPLYWPLDAQTNQILMVHPSMIDDALPGDERVDQKFYQRQEPVSNANIPEDAWYQDKRWDSNKAPVTFIRNEELILIYAEAQAQLDNPGEAVRAINVIRNTWGLADYSGATDKASLIDEILFQRRYSLWAEGGHRWIDARRYDKLDEIRVKYGTVFKQLVKPISESSWDSSQGN